MYRTHPIPHSPVTSLKAAAPRPATLTPVMWRSFPPTPSRTSTPMSPLIPTTNPALYPPAHRMPVARSLNIHSNSSSTRHLRHPARRRSRSSKLCPKSLLMAKDPQPRCSSMYEATRLEYMRFRTLPPSCRSLFRRSLARPHFRLGLSREGRRDGLILISRTSTLVTLFSSIVSTNPILSIATGKSKLTLLFIHNLNFCHSQIAHWTNPIGQ
jgi:hypothetical protein